MTNMNWVLTAQVQVPFTSPVSSINFNSIETGQYATDDTGQITTLSNQNAPIYRIFGKYNIPTNSTLSNSHATSYFTTNQCDYSLVYSGPNHQGSIHSSSWSSATSDSGYYSTGAYWGNGTMKNQYGGYAWGTNVTDDDGVVVGASDRRRVGYNFGCWEWSSNNNVYPVHNWWTICTTDGTADGTSATANSEWGAWSHGAGGNNSTYSMNSFTLYCAYNFTGTFFMYRGCAGDLQANE